MTSNTLSGTYVSFVILMDLLGNSFVLFATIAHKVIKLDKMCVWIIQNIAVFDILNGIVVITPMAISLFNGNVWLLGQFICKLNYIFKTCFFIGNIFAINFLSMNKLFRCMFPLRNMVSSFRQKLAVTIITLIPMLLGPIRKLYVVFLTDIAVVSYSRNHLTCHGYQVVDGVGQPIHPKLERILSVFLIFIPCAALIFINIALVFLAVRFQESKQKEPLHCISGDNLWLPSRPTL